MSNRLVRHALIASFAVGASCAAAGVLPQAALAAARAPAATVTYTKLNLINGWFKDTIDGASTPSVANVSGIITFKGAISTNGTNPNPFILPKAFRPSTTVYVSVDTFDGNYGRLFINTAGQVTVETEGAGPLTNAAAFTSLDGVSFAKSGTGFTGLKLINGWQNYSSGTAKPAVRIISGVVHFRGAIMTSGSSDIPFTLPKGFRPAADLYIPIDLCVANKGRLFIGTNGQVTIDVEQSFSSAQCFTDLEGASFALSGKSFTLLTLKNGWHSYGGGTAKPAVRLVSGIVHFRGAIATKGTSPILFTLPKAFRPVHNVWTPVDLCSANNGRLFIRPNGVVTVQEEGNTFAHASCFTSLDGAWFAR